MRYELFVEQIKQYSAIGVLAICICLTLIIAINCDKIIIINEALCKWETVQWRKFKRNLGRYFINHQRLSMWAKR